MDPREATEFGLIDEVLEHVPKPGDEETGLSPVSDKNDS